MKATKMLLTLIAISTIWANALCAAESLPDTTAPQLIDPSLNEIQNEFLNQQAMALLGLAEETLVQYPPQLSEPPERRLALHLLDGVLHDV